MPEHLSENAAMIGISRPGYRFGRVIATGQQTYSPIPVSPETNNWRWLIDAEVYALDMFPFDVFAYADTGRMLRADIFCRSIQREYRVAG